jgi:hypothetical protein
VLTTAVVLQDAVDGTPVDSSAEQQYSLPRGIVQLLIRALRLQLLFCSLLAPVWNGLLPQCGSRHQCILFSLQRSEHGLGGARNR